MNLPIKFRKSAGVRVSPAAHRLIVMGNRARDARRWKDAADHYRDAVRDDPMLAHIWIQLGHAYKELKEHDAAEGAYREAAKLQPDSAEPLVHLGHLFKDRGTLAYASRSYLQAVRIDPQHPDAVTELMAMTAKGHAISRETLIALASENAAATCEKNAPSVPNALHNARAAAEELVILLRRERIDDEGSSDAPSSASALIAALDSIERNLEETYTSAADDDRPALVFDVSDLISYFRAARLPTGIQRVQIEVISSALREDAQHIQICAFSEYRDEWVEISAGMFLALCRLSLADGDHAAAEWIAATARLQLLMSTADALAFARGSYLINLGTSWWLQNYFLFVRQAKRMHGIYYVPFVHDFIPVMTPEHCVRELTQDFISWAIGAFDHADHFLVNSEATKRDLLTVAAYLGHDVDPDDVAVIRLDADIRKADQPAAPTSMLAHWGLGRDPFVLFVSTIESRKNHLGAFEAWISLLRRHGVRRVPKLVCVGNRGWLNDAVYARLDTHEALRSRVVMLSGLSDPELDLLYRSCLFTLYPSCYEGWGLPVTESLCHGKAPLCSDSSSLPEAGGAFAVYFESGSSDRLAEQLERLMFDSDYRATLEQRIVDGFRPRSWNEIADDMARAVIAWRQRSVAPAMSRYPLARLGAYHPITRNFETKLWRGMRSGEIFRSDSGWWWPDNWGCWTKAHGGEMSIGLPEGEGPLKLYLKIHGLPHRACSYDIGIVGTQLGASGTLVPQIFKWISFDLETPPVDRVLRIRMEGHVTEDLASTTGGLDHRVVSIGVCGFFLCARDDAPTRANFLEAVALGNLDDLAFNRRPVEDDGGQLYQKR